MKTSQTEGKFMFKKFQGGENGIFEEIKKPEELENEHKIIKMIHFGDILYALDLNGNVGTQSIGSMKEFTWVLQHCTDIEVTDCVYAKQFYVDDTVQLKSQTVKLLGDKSEVMRDFQLSMAITEFSDIPGFFTHSLSTKDGLMLLVSGSTLYVRRQVTKKWL